MTADIFQEIRDKAAFVAGLARNVRINEEKITQFCREFPDSDMEKQTYDESIHFRGDDPATVAYVIILDAINFGSGFFPHLKKKTGFSGYYTIASRLTDYFRKNGPLTADQLATCSPVLTCGIFQQTLTDEVMHTLMEQFAEAWRSLGILVEKEFKGDFMTLVQSAGGNAANLVERLCRMPFYRDVHVYEMIEIPFLKRAQITVADLHLAFAGKGPGHFTDIDRLTIFADNLVPHVLRMEGILEYSQDLHNLISAEKLIPAGSEEEIELRGCALHAVELMIAQLNEAGMSINAMELDHMLWNHGQSHSIKQEKRHRTRCVYY